MPLKIDRSRRRQRRASFPWCLRMGHRTWMTRWRWDWGFFDAPLSPTIIGIKDKSSLINENWSEDLIHHTFRVYLPVSASCLAAGKLWRRGRRCRRCPWQPGPRTWRSSRSGYFQQNRTQPGNKVKLIIKYVQILKPIEDAPKLPKRSIKQE